MLASIPRRRARRVLAALTAAAVLCPATACHLGALPAGDAPATAEAPAEIAPAPQAHPPGFEVGQVFRDCPHCPEMVVVPAGSFMMGSDRWPEPVHLVTIGSPFAVGVYEVTFAEWEACASAGGCGGYYLPDDEGWGRGQRPVINVSWEDAQSYVAWLSRETGASYRLLSESEWEYAARAGTTTRYWWGDRIPYHAENPEFRNLSGMKRANCGDCWWNAWETTAPVGSFGANPFGLHDVHGNVREWVQDCWNNSYAGAPGDGSAWEGGDCSLRVHRGASWAEKYHGGAADRVGVKSRFRVAFAGFRVARRLFPRGAPPAGDAPVMAEAPQAQPSSEPAAARPRLEAGQVFRDCPHCPEMVVVPAGTFMMGSEQSAEVRDDPREEMFDNLYYKRERPVHRVTIGSPFAVGVHKVTFGEWDVCASAGGCGGYRPERPDWRGGDQDPMIVSWEDAQSYATWLSRETGESYRLLSESEWEYVTRAGTTTRYWWGNHWDEPADCGEICDNTIWEGESNPFGLHDVIGSSDLEWVQDCRNDSYVGAPGDGNAWESGDCSERVVRGGLFTAGAPVNRMTGRSYSRPASRKWYFRVARTLTP